MQYHFLPYGCPVVLAPFIMMAILSPLSVVSFLPGIKCLYIHGFWTWPSCFIFFHHPLKTYFEKFHCGPKGKKSWKTPWIILWLRVRAIKFRDGYLRSNAQFSWDPHLNPLAYPVQFLVFVGITLFSSQQSLLSFSKSSFIKSAGHFGKQVIFY